MNDSIKDRMGLSLQSGVINGKIGRDVDARIGAASELSLGPTVVVVTARILCEFWLALVSSATSGKTIPHTSSIQVLLSL